MTMSLKVHIDFGHRSIVIVLEQSPLTGILQNCFQTIGVEPALSVTCQTKMTFLNHYYCENTILLRQGVIFSSTAHKIMYSFLFFSVFVH